MKNAGSVSIFAPDLSEEQNLIKSNLLVLSSFLSLFSLLM